MIRLSYDFTVASNFVGGSLSSLKMSIGSYHVGNSNQIMYLLRLFVQFCEITPLVGKSIILFIIMKTYIGMISSIQNNIWGAEASEANAPSYMGNHKCHCIRKFQ